MNKSRYTEARLIARIPQVGGWTREVYAQDARHAQKARSILRRDRTMIDHLAGVDGIVIYVRDVG